MRRTLIIIGLALIVGMFVIFTNRNQQLQNNSLQNVADARVPAKAVPFTKLAYGPHSVVTKRVNYLITSPTELSELWHLVDAKGKIPSVDFTQNEVIAVFAGQQPTTNYAVTVSKVQDSSARMISIMFKNPSSNCASQNAVIAPYEIIVVPTTSLPITHENISTTTTCLE